MPGYSLFITEGAQVQEILIGVKPDLTGFVTQRTEFRSGASLMRPGALLTVTAAGESYALLFLHTASGNDTRGLGLRDDMLVRAVKFRRTLDEAPGADGRANYLFLGDLNTMGMHYQFAREHDIGADAELKKLAGQAGRADMRLLTKDEPATWWNGTDALPPSNLDHVVAADHLEFKQFNNADITVLGWPKLALADQLAWIEENSDHGLLFFEVQRV